MDGLWLGVILLIAVVLAPFVGLFGVGYTIRHKLVRRRLAHEWDGFHAWASRVGVTPSFAPEDDEWRGTIELGGVTVDVSVDTNALDRRRATPATVTLRASLDGRAPEDLHALSGGRWVTSWRSPSLHRLFAVRGEDLGLLAFLSHDLCLELGDAITGAPKWETVEPVSYTHLRAHET